MQTGIDNYGLGRNPWYSEPVTCFLLTEGSHVGDEGQVLRDSTSLPTWRALGGHLTSEAFRWDQRAFAVCLQLPLRATAGADATNGENHAADSGERSEGDSRATSGGLKTLTQWCTSTGGRCIVANTLRGAMAGAEEVLAATHRPSVLVRLRGQTRGEMAALPLSRTSLFLR